MHSVFPTSLRLCALHILDNSGSPKHACAATPVPLLLQAQLNPPQLCDVPSSTESLSVWFSVCLLCHMFTLSTLWDIDQSPGLPPTRLSSLRAGALLSHV